MNMSILFIMLAVLLTVVLSLAAFAPWFWRGRRDGQAAFTSQSAQKNTAHDVALANQKNTLLTLNVSLFRERLAELDDDLANGSIDAGDHAVQKLELERQLLAASDDLKMAQTPPRHFPKKTTALACVLGVSLATMLGYLSVFDRSEVFKLWQAQANMDALASDMLSGAASQPPPSFTQGDVQKNTQELIQAMQVQVYKNPSEPTRWLNLSQTYMVLEAVPAALEALSRARRLAPDDLAVAMTYAQVRYFSGSGELDAEVRKTLNDVLKREPQHEGAQMLMAMGEVKSQNFEAANAWVVRLKHTLQTKAAADGGDRSAALASLSELEAVIAAKLQEKNNPVAGSDVLSVRVVLADDAVLKTRLANLANTDKAALFVVARASADGKPSGPPYAVKRFALKAVGAALMADGVTLSLSDNDSMMPALTLSSAKRDKIPLVLTAKISQTGRADASEGDLTSAAVAADAHAEIARDVVLTIGE